MADAMPTWEQIVDWVTISSNYLAVAFAESKWQEAVRQSEETIHWTTDLSRRNAESWRGPGAEAFRAHLKGLVDAVEADAVQQRKTARGLKRCAEALKTAVRSIPIPSWQEAEVRQRQLDFVLNGVPSNIQPHVFWQTLVGPNAESWPGPALKEAERFCREAEQRAQAAYQRLCQEYREAAAEMPEGTQVPVPGVDKGVGTGAAPAAQKSQPAPATTPPASTLPATQPQPPPTTTPPTSTPWTDLPPFDPPPVTTPDLPDLDTSLPGSDFDPSGGLDDKRLGTGLAGAGSGGFGGGLGTGGLGAGLGSVAALGTPGMGPAATPPPGVLAARLAAGAGASGTGMPFMPMTPMAGGHPGAGEGADQTRSGRLQEDEDIFLAPQASSGIIDI